MRFIVATLRRSPAGGNGNPEGGFWWPSDSAASAKRCTTSPLRTLLAGNRQKPSSWVRIGAGWYELGVEVVAALSDGFGLESSNQAEAIKTAAAMTDLCPGHFGIEIGRSSANPISRFSSKRPIEEGARIAPSPLLDRLEALDQLPEPGP